MTTPKTRPEHIDISPGSERLGVICTAVGRRLTGTLSGGSNRRPDYLPLSDVGHVAAEWVLGYVVCGSGFVEFRDGKHHTFEAGSVTLVSPGTWYRFRVDPDTDSSVYYVAFDGESLTERKVCTAIDELYPVARVGLHTEVIELFQWLLSVARSNRAGAQRELGATIVLLVAKLVNCFHEARLQDTEPTAAERACAIMLTHVTEHVSIEHIAHELHVPVSTFRRVFRKETGVSPYRFFLGCKVDAVKHELVRGDLPLRTIAEKYGFVDQYHLSRVFRSVTGTRPSFWKHNNSTVSVISR